MINLLAIDKVQQCTEIKTSLPEIDIMFEYEMSEPHDLIQETLQNNIKLNLMLYLTRKVYVKLRVKHCSLFKTD